MKTMRVLKLIVLAIALQYCECDADGSGRYIIDNSTNRQVVMRLFLDNILLETLQVMGEGTIFDRTLDTGRFTGPEPYEVLDADSVVVEFDDKRRISFAFQSIPYELNNYPPEARSPFNVDSYKKVKDGVLRYVFTESDYEIAIEY